MPTKMTHAAFLRNRKRDRTGLAPYVLIGTQLEKEAASPNHRSVLPFESTLSSSQDFGDRRQIAARYGPASKAFAVSPTAVDAALRDTSRLGLWRTRVSPKAKETPENASGGNTISARSPPQSALQRCDGPAPSSSQVKSVDVWPRKKQWVSMGTATEEKKNRVSAAVKHFCGTLNQETLTAGYRNVNAKSAEEEGRLKSVLQEDFEWPADESYGMYYHGAAGLGHTEGHGHRLACEHMRSFRGGTSKFEHMASGGGVGHDHASTRFNNISRDTTSS